LAACFNALVGVQAVAIAGGPAVENAKIAAVGPAKLAQTLFKHDNWALAFGSLASEINTPIRRSGPAAAHARVGGN
jgi:hypothetical protein